MQQNACLEEKMKQGIEQGRKEGVEEPGFRKV